jgi:hypothetical protein
MICSFNFLIFLAVCLNISTVINIKILTNSNQQIQSYKSKISKSCMTQSGHVKMDLLKGVKMVSTIFHWFSFILVSNFNHPWLLYIYILLLMPVDHSISLPSIVKLSNFKGQTFCQINHLSLKVLPYTSGKIWSARLIF